MVSHFGYYHRTCYNCHDCHLTLDSTKTYELGTTKEIYCKNCYSSHLGLAGYGYGIPLSRLYARYLGGDLMLQSVEGYGTDCYIYLKSGNNDAVEVLPIFTNQLGEHYRSKKEMKDWVSKAGLISSNQLNTSMGRH